jgi:chromosome segregation ATPase
MQNTILEKNEAFEGARILEGRIKEQIERYEIESERSQAIWEEMLRKMLQPPQKPLMNIDRIPFVMKEFMDANAKLVTAINNEWTAVHNERQRLCDWQHELDQKTTELANRESKAAETEAALNLWVQKLNAQAAELAEEDKKSKERSKRLGENAKALSDLDRTLKAQEEELKRCKEKLKEQEKHTDLPARLEFEQQLKEVREAISELQQARATEAEMIQQVVSTISSVLQPFGLSFVRSKLAARTVNEMLPELTAAVEKLVPLPEVVSEALETEGAELACAVAEHVLRCYRSRKPDFPLEPALSGPVEETAEEVGTDAGLQDAAKAVASRFERIPMGHE